MVLRDIIDSPTVFKWWASNLRPVWALDTETTSLNWLNLEILGFSISDGKQACYVNCNTKYKKELLLILEYYLNEAQVVIFHNFAYDNMVLKKYGIEYSGKIFDTLFASHLLNENLNENGLKFLTKEYLHRDVVEYEDAVKYGVDSHEFAMYAMDDAINTYDLYRLFAPQIEKEGLHHLAYDIEFPFARVLTELNINGIKADVDAARKMKYEVQHLYYAIENELLEIFGGQYNVWITPRSRVLHCEPSINFNSSDQVIPLIEGLGFEIYEKSKKGAKSWGKRAKNRLAGKHPAVDLLIKFGKVEKLLSGFLNPFGGFIDEDERIRCSFHNTVAVTGRLSCSSPNIEQLPQNNDLANIRNLFIASDDNIFIVADYSGQELRILGEESKDKNLIQAFKDGRDLHAEVAESMGIERTDAKTVNFGIPYGKEAYGFSKDWNCSLEEAQERIDKYFKSYPSVLTRIERCREAVRLHNFVRNMSGRKRRFPDFNKGSKWQKARCYRQAFNFLIQSYGADVVKIAATKIITNLLLKIVNVVHDEIVVECPKYYADEGVKFIEKCMITALPISIPWELKIQIVERYGDAEK